MIKPGDISSSGYISVILTRESDKRTFRGSGFMNDHDDR